MSGRHDPNISINQEVSARESGKPLSKNTQEKQRHKLQGKSGNAISVNYNAVCDLDRMERFKQIFLQICQCQKLMPIFSLILRETEQVISSSNTTIFLFKSDVTNTKHMNVEMTVQKNVLDGKFIDALSLVSNPAVDPQFQKNKDAYVAKKEQNFMSFPIFTPGGDLYMNF